MNGYSQQFVADYLGVVRQTYSHYETGRIEPGMDIILKLSELYGENVESLIGKLTVEEKDTVTDDLICFCEENKNKLSSLSAEEKKLLFYYEELSRNEKEDLQLFLKSKIINSRKRNKNK